MAAAPPGSPPPPWHRQPHMARGRLTMLLVKATATPFLIAFDQKHPHAGGVSAKSINCDTRKWNSIGTSSCVFCSSNLCCLQAAPHLLNPRSLPEGLRRNRPSTPAFLSLVAVALFGGPSPLTVT
jgi:hypothetical protein